MARRALTAHDREAWALYAQNVAALPGRAAPALPLPAEMPAALPGPSAPPRLSAAPMGAAAPRAAAPGFIEVGRQPGGVDNGTWGKLRGGKLRAVRTLDLHGRTAQAAFLALQAFLQHAHADRLRCVEIITGRGSGESGGVIRRELPLWLNLPPIRPMVLAATHPHQANVGAVRVLLRKPR